MLGVLAGHAATPGGTGMGPWSRVCVRRAPAVDGRGDRVGASRTDIPPPPILGPQGTLRIDRPPACLFAEPLAMKLEDKMRGAEGLDAAGKVAAQAGSFPLEVGVAGAGGGVGVGKESWKPRRTRRRGQGRPLRGTRPRPPCCRPAPKAQPLGGSRLSELPGRVGGGRGWGLQAALLTAPSLPKGGCTQAGLPSRVQEALRG